MKVIYVDDVSFDGIASIICDIITATNNRQTWISLRVNASTSAPKVEPFFGSSFTITINCSSTAYGWGWLQSDNAQNQVYYGRLSDSKWTWYKVGKQDDIDALNLNLTSSADNIAGAIREWIDMAVAKGKPGFYSGSLTWSGHFSGVVVANVHVVSPARVTFLYVPQVGNNSGKHLTATLDGSNFQVYEFEGSRVL